MSQRFVVIFDAANFETYTVPELVKEFANRWPELPEDACTLYSQDDFTLSQCTLTTERVSADDQTIFYRTTIVNARGGHEASINFEHQKASWTK